MITVYICLGFVFVLVIDLVFIAPYIKRKELEKNLKEISSKNQFEFKIDNKKPYDYILENDTNKLYIAVSYIPSNSALTINSKNTFCLTYGGNKNNPGRMKPNKKYLYELTEFLNMKVIDEEKKVRKIVILYKNTEKIQMYLNESELKLINKFEQVYDYTVVTFVDFKESFNELL